MTEGTKTRGKGSNGNGTQKHKNGFNPATVNTPPQWNLRLYIAGRSARATAAIENLQRICEEHLKGKYVIEVIDLLKNPRLAAGDQIIAVPTLVRRLPPPIRKIIGDLSDTERVLVGLDIKSYEESE